MTEIKTETKVNDVKPRRKYEDAFKRQAVDLWVSSGKPARQIANELGIAKERLRRWKAERATAPPPPSEADLQTEVAELRRENALLRQQRDILKKTLGILSEPPNNATNGSTR